MPHWEKLKVDIDARRATCAVIGLGFVGKAIVEALLSAGFVVRGYDCDSTAVRRLHEQFSQAGSTFQSSADLDILRDVRVVFIAIRTQFDNHGRMVGKPYEDLIATLVPRVAQNGVLVLFISTVPPGTTSRFAELWHKQNAHPPLAVACSPERLAVGQDWRQLRVTPRLVGGTDASVTQIAKQLLLTFTDRVIAVSRPEVCEVSKLLENTFRCVGIALISEITRLAHAMNLSSSEICEAAATKPDGYFPFFPGPGIGGHCLPNDQRILQQAFQELGMTAPVLDAADRATQELPAQLVQHLERCLLSRGQRMSEAAVLLVGVGFKPGSDDTTNTPAEAVVRALRNAGADVQYADTRVSHFVVDDTPVNRVQLDFPPANTYGAALLLSGDSAYSLKHVCELATVVIDAGGGRIMSADSGEVGSQIIRL